MSILKKIYEYKLDFVSKQKSTVSQKEIELKIKTNLKKNISFYNKLNSQNKEISIIGEIKKASPSLGKFVNEKVDIIKIAEIYEKNNISCLSILTDEKYFGGHINDLIEIRNKTSIPILRKDFIVDDYQIYESKLHGADCILIILSMLSKDVADRFDKIALELEMDTIIEVHNHEELQIAKKMNSKIIGINNRNLNTFVTDLNTTIALSKYLKNTDKLVISESGFNKKNDIDKILKATTVNNFLIGEYLMKSSSDLPLKISKLLN